MTAQVTRTAMILDRLRSELGSHGVIADPKDMEPYLVDWRGAFRGSALGVARPANTEQVAATVRLCSEHQIPIVPQGGNTGLCGGGIPDAGGTALVVALGRMNKVVEVDALNNTITVEAGCILANIQQQAAAADRLFPLSLGAEGSCQIGGNLSTNAGGNNVLRYGNARELVLGLEVVLPDGRIWDGLRGLRKDNTGYDLKQLFIGAEGTLGIITKAVLKLFPKPARTVTALVAAPDVQSAVELLAFLKRQCGDVVTSFELMARHSLDIVFRYVAGNRDPLSERYPWYVLVELGDTRDSAALQEEFEAALAAVAERGLILDAVIGQSAAQAKEFWRLRESIPEAVRAEGAVYRHDVSVPVSRISEFIKQASAELAMRFPGTQLICFGHVGDGNLHFNVTIPKQGDDRPIEPAAEVTRIVHDNAHRLRGSISAEHGIGQSKRGELSRYKSAIELDLMRTIKAAMDRQNLMNPGKVL